MYHKPVQAHKYVRSNQPGRVLHRSISRERDRLRDRKRRDEDEVDNRVGSGRDLKGINSTQRTYAMVVYPQHYSGIYSQEETRR